MYLVLYTDMDIEHQEQAYMKYLIDDLEEYAHSDYYPFHMPGHKRKSLAFPNPYEIDITEIDGFDNLHHATGMIKEAEVRGAELYHSKRCFFLVNGSTCGLLAAISAATRRGDKVLVARNCHKAVYHALYMNELQAEYLYPSITKNGIQGQITAEQVQESLYENPDAVAVILTSPTYEGIVSDVAKIAEVCHEHGIPLIVDEAHGAHFGFGGGFPENAVKLGADAVIMSLHKTLPSFTQTALLHLTSDLIDEKRVERYLSIYETSSPSYIFMAGMDSCIRLIAEHGQQLFAEYRKRLMDFYGKTAGLKYLHVMQEEDLDTGEAFDWDDSKLVIFADRAGMTGDELKRLAFSYGNRPGDFRAIMEHISAIPVKHGDIAYEVEIFPEYKIQMILWEGDEEFPPSSQILFSDNFPVSFQAEDMAVMGDVIIGSLKAYLKCVQK